MIRLKKKKEIKIMLKSFLRNCLIDREEKKIPKSILHIITFNILSTIINVYSKVIIIQERLCVDLYSFSKELD